MFDQKQTDAIAAALDAASPAPTFGTFKAGTRLHVNLSTGTAKDTKRTGVWEVIDLDPYKTRRNAQPGLKLQQVSADGSRLIPRKTFTLTVAEYVTASGNRSLTLHTLVA